MSIFSDVISSIDTAVSQVVTAAEADVAKWWGGFEPIVAADFKAFEQAVGPVLLQLILTLGTASIGGPAKLAAASAAAIALAEAQGIKATQTMANTLVQQFVGSIAAQIGQTPPKAP